MYGGGSFVICEKFSTGTEKLRKVSYLMQTDLKYTLGRSFRCSLFLKIFFDGLPFVPRTSVLTYHLSNRELERQYPYPRMQTKVWSLLGSWLRHTHSKWLSFSRPDMGCSLRRLQQFRVLTIAFRIYCMCSCVK